MVRALIVFGAVMASFVGFGSTAIRHQLRDRKIFRMRYNSFDDPPGPRGNNVTQQLVTTRPPLSQNTQRAVEDPASSSEEETPELLTQKSSNKDDNPINGSDKAISSIVDEIMKKITPEPTTITETTTALDLSKISGKIKRLKFIFGKIKNSSDLREIVVAMVSDIAVELKSIGKTKLDLEAFEAVSGCTVCVGNMTEEELLKILFVQQVCKSKSITYPENDTEMNQFAIATVDNSWAAALQYELLTQKLWTAEYFRPSNVSNSPLEDVETIQKLLPS